MHLRQADKKHTAPRTALRALPTLRDEIWMSLTGIAQYVLAFHSTGNLATKLATLQKINNVYSNINIHNNNNSGRFRNKEV
jgi:hypothetical protein